MHMCGIFCYFCRTGVNTPRRNIVDAALAVQHRGPDATHIIHGTIDHREVHGTIDRYHLVFHRLMVNGLSPESGQPLAYPPSSKPTYYLLCNGEIYNYRELIEEYGLHDVYDSSSDCEIILHLYHLVQTAGTIPSFSDMLMKLRGVFAFTLLDLERHKIMIGRDPLGVRSLYYSNDMRGFGVCSELKGLYPLSEASSILQFPGGCYSVLDYSSGIDKFSINRYYSVESPLPFTCASETGVAKRIVELLKQSIKRRTMCDRQTADGHPAIGAYLSGGLDSSAIAGLLSSIYPGKLHTFSIGFKNAPDLLAAREVAEYIGSHHHEVVVTEDEMLKLLPQVPKIIESYDATTNRASAFMIKLSEYIRDNTDIIVVYSGEGSDELFGSYLYFHNAPDATSFHADTIRLLRDLQYFDLLRGDKSSAMAGLEIRLPFLDIDFVEYIKTIPPSLKMRNGIEKYILRKAIADTELIPQKICDRTKDAMSDGVSHDSRSWSTIVQNYVSSGSGSGSDPVTLEKEWYKTLFSSEYPGCEATIPYEWLPKWCGDVKDSSARTLKIYAQRTESSGASRKK